MFQNNTLDSPKRWLDAGYRVFPCQEKKALVQWQTENKKIFYEIKQNEVKMNDLL